MGGWRVFGAPNSARRAQKAWGWGPGAGCAKAEGTRGCDAGLTMARRPEASGSPAGGSAGPVGHRLPAGARSRRVWLQDSSHGGRGSVRSLARSLAGAPRPRGPAREGRDGRLHRPAQPGTPAETPPPSQASPPLPSLSAASPPRPAPSENRPAEDALVSRVFSLCGIRSALALDAAEISRLGPRLSSGQKPSSISETHDTSPCGQWPGLARSWGPDRPTRSGSPQVELRAEKVGDLPALGVCPPFFPFHLLGSRESRQLQWASVCCLGRAGGMRGRSKGLAWGWVSCPWITILL